ncbi:MAG TPA: hypothetical protein VJ623_13225 [Holophagaceae bacterium]|nr:hypothetical protein [Holophagaceae bacterium]
MSHDLVLSLQHQNRLLKGALALGGTALLLALSVAAKPARTRFAELEVERLNLVSTDGKTELVIANHQRLPKAVVDGKAVTEDRGMPGLIFYNQAGDECGGLVWKGNLGPDGKPESGMHLSMDRFGGDQQLALGHYEEAGRMNTGLNIYDRGLNKAYGPLFEAMEKAPEGPEKEKLKAQWLAAGGRQTSRLFVGRTGGDSSAVILADKQGKARIMMLVKPDGTPSLRFLDEKGEVVQSFPEAKK